MHIPLINRFIINHGCRRIIGFFQKADTIDIFQIINQAQLIYARANNPIADFFVTRL